MYSFNEILSRMLKAVPSNVDKREGSIIYDALAPAAAELAQLYIDLEIYKEQTYLLTATGENLDNRGADFGMIRDAASKSIRLGEMKNINEEYISIPIVSRFSTPDTNITYIAIEEIEVGQYKLQCEQTGTIGDEYSGDLLPIYFIENLVTASISTIIIPGQNDETDEVFRKRIMDRINQPPFGGNKSDYLEFINDIEGIEGAKVFPVWNGGGTVKVSFIGSNYTIPSEEFIEEVQTKLDPIANQGQGLGLAPIGHTVTVVAPNPITINVEATLNLENAVLISQVQTSVENAIKSYLQEVQNEWAETDEKLTIYIK